MSFYSESCIWPDRTSRWIRQENSIKFYENIGRSSTETLTMIRQAFGEENMSRARKGLAQRDRRLPARWRAKSKACSTCFFDNKGLFIKKFGLQAEQAIPHTTVTSTAIARKCAKTSPQTLATKELPVASWQRTFSHTLIHKGIFYQTHYDCRLPPTLLFFMFLWLKIKPKHRHFGTIEVIEGESQAVLNTLAEHNFQDTFTQWRKRWWRCLRAEGVYF
jgi:hypothetical protein